MNGGLAVQTSQTALGSPTVYNSGLGVNGGLNQQTSTVLSAGGLGNTYNYGLLSNANLGSVVGGVVGSTLGTLSGATQPAVAIGNAVGTTVGNTANTVANTVTNTVANTGGIALNNQVGGSNLVVGVVGSSLGNTLNTLNGVSQINGGSLIDPLGTTGGNYGGYIVANSGAANGNNFGSAVNGNIVYTVDALGNTIGLLTPPFGTATSLSTVGSGLLNTATGAIGTGVGNNYNAGTSGTGVSGGTSNTYGGGLISNSAIAPNIGINLGGTQTSYQANTNTLSQQAYQTQVVSPVSTSYNLIHPVWHLFDFINFKLKYLFVRFICFYLFHSSHLN